MKIKEITVPSVVVMEHGVNFNENSRQLSTSSEFVLDCDFEMEMGEKEDGLVVKWLLNNQPVYQWIPPRMPTPLSLFKNRIRKNFTINDDAMTKYRAVSVIKPTLNFSGEYSCSVQTFQSSDKKSANLQIIGMSPNSCEVFLWHF